MKKGNSLLIILAVMFAVAGCGANEDSLMESGVLSTSSDASIKPSQAGQHFTEHYKKAESFGDLWDEALKLQERGEFAEANVIWEKAHEIADGKAHKSIVLENMAKNYEQLGEYEVAANFYQTASDLQKGMGKMLEEKFAAKAEELRQKTKLLSG